MNAALHITDHDEDGKRWKRVTDGLVSMDIFPDKRVILRIGAAEMLLTVAEVLELQRVLGGLFSTPDGERLLRAYVEEGF